MQAQAYKILHDEIIKLPFEKVGKVLSFVKYLEQEAETELYIDPLEETELHELYHSNDVVAASDVLAKIKALQND
jgi:vancomycin permeability regulator SanA